jgi:predicted permease
MRDTQLVVGRLQPGARVSVVEAEARGRFKAAIAQDGSSKTNVLTVRSGLHVDESEPIERQGLAVYRLSIGAGLLLLLLACANAANLLLARLARRERTFALCTAVGASRARVLRPVFVECACLAALATALGLGLASFVTRGLRGTRVFVGAPTLVDVPIDGRVVSFAVAIAAATLIAFTVLPALMGSRADARGLLQQAARGTSGRSRMRHALVVVQLALALALAAGAGELTRSMAYLRSLDLGMKPDGVVEFRLDAIQLAYGVGAKNRQFAKDVAASLAHLNGVTSVAVASPSVFDQEQFAMLIRPASAPPDAAPLSGAHRVVSSAYFATLGIPVVAGRAFADTEYLAGSARAGSPAILSESAARRLFGTPGGALGRHVTLSDARMATDPRRHDVEVVGVAGDTRTGFSYLREAVPAIYEPDNAIWGWSTFYLASGLPTPQAEETVRSAMHSLVPGMPILDVQTVREELDAMFPEERMIAMILRAIAAFAVALGLFGVAAVMASTLTERMRELGIRSALGASASQLVRDALRPALTLSLIGAACGLGAFALASRALVARVHGIAVWDPATLALTTSLLIVAALVAAWAPARRMSRIDPTIVLRIE